MVTDFALASDVKESADERVQRMILTGESCGTLPSVV